MAPDEGSRDRALMRLLREAYGLAVERLAPAPRGWTGETFVAALADGTRAFVKVYPRDRLPPTAAAALPALAALHRAGLAQVGRPIRAASGAYHARLDRDLVAVFDHLDAAREPFTFGGAELGDLIARLHGATAHVTAQVAREAFAPEFGDAVPRMLDRAREGPATDAPRSGLRAFVDRHAAFISDARARFVEIARACRAAPFDPVPTHGDWPFNLLRDRAGTLHLIDWDELILAPPERDTWFAGDDAPFWRAYRARRPGHAVSALFAAYYVHRRFFEELVAFAGDILDDDAPRERRADALALLDGEWMAGLRARMT